MHLITAVLLLISSPFGSDTEAIHEINQIKEQMKGYYSTNLDSAAILAEMIIVKSTEANYELGRAKGEFALAHIAYKWGKISLAIPHFLKALEIYKPLKSNDSLTDQANIYIMLGVIFRRHQSFQEAFNFYDLGIKAALAANNKSALRSLLYNKSIAYRRKGNLEKAMDALTRSLDFLPEDNKVLKQRTYNQSGLIYFELQDYDTARKWYNKIIQLEIGNQPSRYSGQAYHNIASSYFEQNNYKMAWKYYQLALKEKEPLGNPEKTFLTYQNMAELALHEEQKEEALNYAKKALTLIDKVPKTPELYNLYLILADCVEESDPTMALSYAKQYISETESFHTRQKELLDEEKQYRVKLATMRYEKETLTEKYEHRMLIGSIIIGLSIILMAIGLFKMLQNPMKYRYSVFQRHMKKLKKEEAKRLALEHKKSTQKHAQDLEETRKLLKK